MTDLANMRASFRRRAAGLADDLTGGDGDVDAYLNHSFQHRVPDRIPGQLTDGTWDLTLIGLQETYDFPDYVHSVRVGVRIGNFDIAFYAREIEFWHRHDPEDSSVARPVSVLVKGRKVQFYKKPDVAYTVVFNTRNYPITGDPNEPDDNDTLAIIPATGIGWFTHADAVIWGGLIEFAEDFDLTNLLAKAEGKFAHQTAVMRSRSLTMYQDRRRRRTY